MNEIPSSLGLRQVDITPEINKADTLRFLDELYGSAGRIPEFVKRTKKIPAGEPGSAEDVRAKWNFWRDARKGIGLPRYDAAAALGMHVNTLGFIEAGVGKPEEIGDIGTFHERYAQVLGDPLLVSQFQQRFPNHQ